MAVVPRHRPRLLAWRPLACFPSFDSSETEAAFSDHLAPQVAWCTTAGHAIALGVHSVLAAWSMTAQTSLPTNRFTWAAGDVRTACFSVVLVVLALQLSLCIVLGAIGYCAPTKRWDWELISVLSVSGLGVVVPWLNPWHGSTIYGADPTEAWTFATEECEALWILGLVAVTAAYTISVPARSRFTWILPTLCALSYLLLVTCVGSPYPDSLLLKVLALMCLLFLPLLGARSKELLLRELWLASWQAGSEQPEEDACSAEVGTGGGCDFEFKLTASYQFFGSNARRDSFFGQAVEGERLPDFMTSWDARCFTDLIDRMPAMTKLEGIRVELNRVSGLAQVSLDIAQRGDVGRLQGAPYLVRLRVFQEGVAKSSSLTSTLPSLKATERTDVAEHSSQDFSPGVLPGMPVFTPRSQTGMSLDLLSDSTWRDDGVCSRPMTQEFDSMKEMFKRASASITTQTSDGLSLGRTDRGVNTSLVWLEDGGFKCTNCAKPPKLPGCPSPCSPRTPRQKKSGSSKKKTQKYEGDLFDGGWVICDEDEDKATPWMTGFVINGCDVLLGDGDEESLVEDEDGAVLLCGGILYFEGDQLIRQGKSGRKAAFDRVDAEDLRGVVLNRESSEGQPSDYTSEASLGPGGQRGSFESEGSHLPGSLSVSGPGSSGSGSSCPGSSARGSFVNEGTPRHASYVSEESSCCPKVLENAVTQDTMYVSCESTDAESTLVQHFSEQTETAGSGESLT